MYLATRASDINRVLTLHGFYPGAKNELALRFVLPRTDLCIVVSEEVLRLVTEKGLKSRADFVVINNGVDARRLQVPGKNLRDELGMVAEQVLFGMIGNFSPVAQKDQLTVCRALPKVFQQIPEAHFVFVGGRSEAAPQLFEECVDVCGAQVFQNAFTLLENVPTLAPCCSHSKSLSYLRFAKARRFR